MKNWLKSRWGNLLSLLATGVSVVAICISLPTENSLQIDYMGVLLGILSLLTTLLIGWQIFNFLTFEYKMRRMMMRTVGDAVKKMQLQIADDFGTTNLFVINQYAETGNYNLAVFILKTTYIRLEKIKYYTAIETISSPAIILLEKYNKLIDTEEINELLPILQKVSFHSATARKLLDVCRRILKDRR